MSFFDFFSGDRKKTHEKWYGKGVGDAQNDDWFDKAYHAVEDLGTGMFGKGPTESQSYEAGYHSGKKRRRSRKASTSSYEVSDTKIGPVLIFLLCLFLVGWLWTPKPGSAPLNTGTMRRINANELNLRSGPGTNYSIVRTFGRNEEIVSFDEQQEADGYIWVRAQTPDGQAQGWIVKKFLSRK